MRVQRFSIKAIRFYTRKYMGLKGLQGGQQKHSGRSFFEGRISGRKVQRFRTFSG